MTIDCIDSHMISPIEHFVSPYATYSDRFRNGNDHGYTFDLVVVPSKECAADYANFNFIVIPLYTMPCGHSIFGHMNNTAATMVMTAQDNDMIDCDNNNILCDCNDNDIEHDSREWNTLDTQILG